MEALLATLEAFQGTTGDFLEVDRGFHLVLYQAAGSQRWIETIQTLWQRSKRYMLIALSSDELAQVVQADHRQLLNFCKERDVSQAEATIRAHLKRSEEYLLLHWSTKGNETDACSRVGSCVLRRSRSLTMGKKDETIW